MLGTDREEYPVLSNLLRQQLEVFPDHRFYLNRRFKGASEEHMALTEMVARQVAQVAGAELPEVLEDYAWLSREVIEEELYFRRTGQYRLDSFEEAERLVYSDPVYMHRYMNGLLASQVWWRNHTDIIGYYVSTYLSGLTEGFRHLEIGPGHGLFLYQTAAAANPGSLTAWDISEVSLRNTRAALDAMGVERPVELAACNLFEAPAGEFDSITFSEVLEHLEQPFAALQILGQLLAKDGRLFVNAPVNSPAPDHIYLFRTPEEVIDMVERAGFEVLNRFFAPTTGATLQQARKRELAISVAVIASPRQER